jgi:RNA polymerase sigma-70 factor (ECF subfamily)
VLEDGAEGAVETLETATDLRRTVDVALAAFDRLTPRQRQVVDLCDRRDHTPTEAAELLDIAPGTARALLHQGRRAVREAVLAETGADVLELLRGTGR